jgi:hypothetical protein
MLKVLEGDAMTPVLALLLATGPAAVPAIEQPAPPSENIPRGRGAVTYINAKAAPFFAAGDGATDDTVAINAALQAAVSSQKHAACVHLPAGIYLVTDTIKMYRTRNRTSSDGLCLYGEGGLATILRWKTNDKSKPVLQMNGASQRLENLAIELLGDARTALAYSGDPAIGRSTMGHIGNLHINCNHHLGDGIQLGPSQADMLELDHPQIENCSQGNALVTSSANVLSINVIAAFFNRNQVGFNVDDSSNVHIFGGEFDAHDLILKKGGIGTVEFYGMRAEGPKRVFFDSAGKGSDPVTFNAIRVDSMNTTRPRVSGTISAGSNQLTLSAPGYTYGDVLVLSSAGAGSGPLTVMITGMTDLTHVTVFGKASSTMVNGRIGFYGYGSTGNRCTVATTAGSTAVTFSDPWCMNPAEYVTIVDAGINSRRIASCSDGTHCTLQSAATATLPAATWFRAGGPYVPRQPQAAFVFQMLGPYTIVGSTFGSQTGNATTVSGGGGGSPAVLKIAGNFWNVDPGNATPWSSSQLPVGLGISASENIFGTAAVQTMALGRSTFANLPPAAPDSTILYCTDCLANSNPCVGASSGALTVRQNGAWACK